MLQNISILKYIKYLFKHPDRFRASKFLAFKILAYRVFKKGSPIFKIIKSASNNLNNHFKELDDHLEGKSWIDGDNFSLADVTWMVLFHRLSEVFLLDYFFEDKNNLKSYFDRLKKRDSYQTALKDYESDEIRIGKLNLEFELDNNKNLNQYYEAIKL
jgi:glutathione S-transferase